MAKVLARMPQSFPSVQAAVDWHCRTGAVRSEAAANIVVPSRLIPLEDGQDGQDGSGDGHTPMTWRTNLWESSKYWQGWFQGLSSAFLSLPMPKMLVVAGMDRLDTELTIAQLKGRYQLKLVYGAGHSVQEDQPRETSHAIMQFAQRHSIFSSGTRSSWQHHPTEADDLAARLERAKKHRDLGSGSGPGSGLGLVTGALPPGPKGTSRSQQGSRDKETPPGMVRGSPHESHQRGERDVRSGFTGQPVEGMGQRQGSGRQGMGLSPDARVKGKVEEGLREDSSTQHAGTEEKEGYGEECVDLDGGRQGGGLGWLEVLREDARSGSKRWGSCPSSLFFLVSFPSSLVFFFSSLLSRFPSCLFLFSSLLFVQRATGYFIFAE
ncbi:unnamed protein product [Discosporangium mesarthrocarpum]